MEDINIRNLRERLGESQETFALRFGICQSTISRWETDGIPHRGVARMAVDRLRKELDDIAGGGA